MAELGRFPMKLSIDIQMVKYFLRLDKLPKGRFFTQIIYCEQTTTEKQERLELSYKRNTKQMWSFVHMEEPVNNIKQDKKDDFIYRLIFTRMNDISSQNASAYINKDKNKNCGKNEFFITNKTNLHLRTLFKYRK